MTDNSAFLLAEVAAIQAEIEAMKLQNEIDKAYNLPITYGSEMFFAAASNIRSLINQYR